MRGGKIDLPIVVPEQVLVKARLVEVDRIRPRLRVPDVLGLDVKSLGASSFVAFLWSVSIPNAGRQVEPSIVVTERARPYTAAMLRRLDVQLRLPGQGMSDQGPLDEICAVVDGRSGSIFER